MNSDIDTNGEFSPEMFEKSGKLEGKDMNSDIDTNGEFSPEMFEKSGKLEGKDMNSDIDNNGEFSPEMFEESGKLEGKDMNSDVDNNGEFSPETFEDSGKLEGKDLNSDADNNGKFSSELREEKSKFNDNGIKPNADDNKFAASGKYDDVKNTYLNEAEKNMSATEQIERTSKFEDQTVDNFKLEEKRQEIDLKLGDPHNSNTLRYNLDKVIGKTSNPENSNAHHLVGNDTPQALKKLHEMGIDINDPANGILLPNSPESPLKGAVHGQGRHTAEYSNEVERRFAKVKTREEALEVLQSLKEDLYNGNLNVHNDVKPNK